MAERLGNFFLEDLMYKICNEAKRLKALIVLHKPKSALRFALATLIFNDPSACYKTLICVCCV